MPNLNMREHFMLSRFGIYCIWFVVFVVSTSNSAVRTSMASELNINFRQEYSFSIDDATDLRTRGLYASRPGKFIAIVSEINSRICRIRVWRLVDRVNILDFNFECFPFATSVGFSDDESYIQFIGDAAGETIIYQFHLDQPPSANVQTRAPLLERRSALVARRSLSIGEIPATNHFISPRHSIAGIVIIDRSNEARVLLVNTTNSYTIMSPSIQQRDVMRSHFFIGAYEQNRMPNILIGYTRDSSRAGRPPTYFLESFNARTPNLYANWTRQIDNIGIPNRIDIVEGANPVAFMTSGAFVREYAIIAIDLVTGAERWRIRSNVLGGGVLAVTGDLTRGYATALLVSRPAMAVINTTDGSVVNMIQTIPGAEYIQATNRGASIIIASRTRVAVLSLPNAKENMQ